MSVGKFRVLLEKRKKREIVRMKNLLGERREKSF